MHSLKPVLLEYSNEDEESNTVFCSDLGKDTSNKIFEAITKGSFSNGSVLSKGKKILERAKGANDSKYLEMEKLKKRYHLLNDKDKSKERELSKNKQVKTDINNPTKPSLDYFSNQRNSNTDNLHLNSNISMPNFNQNFPPQIPLKNFNPFEMQNSNLQAILQLMQIAQSQNKLNQPQFPPQYLNPTVANSIPNEYLDPKKGFENRGQEGPFPGNLNNFY